MSIAQIQPKYHFKRHESQSLNQPSHYVPMSWIASMRFPKGSKESQAAQREGPKDAERREQRNKPTETRGRGTTRQTNKKTKKRATGQRRKDRRTQSRRRGKHTGEHTTEGGNVPHRLPPTSKRATSNRNREKREQRGEEGYKLTPGDSTTSEIT